MGTAQLDIDDGRRDAEEFSSIVQLLEEERLQRGRGTVQVWGIDANVHLDELLEGYGVRQRSMDTAGHITERVAEFAELVGAEGLRTFGLCLDIHREFEDSAEPAKRDRTQDVCHATQSPSPHV